MINKKKIPKFVPQKDVTVEWNSFNGGWNNYSRPTELKPNELAQADNMMLVGIGTPTGRWGVGQYDFDITQLSYSLGKIRLFDAYYNANASINNLIIVDDTGLLKTRSKSGYTSITGASFASGYTMQSAQLGNNLYIAANNKNLVKFDGTNLIPYVGLSSPSTVSLAIVSNASGFNTYSWIVTAQSLTGETTGSAAKTLASLPLDLTKTQIRVQWSAVSSAPSVLTKYNIYRGFPGNETFLASVDKNTTQYIDVGNQTSFTVFPPTSDLTSGPKAKYILKVDDRLVLAGVEGDPSKVYISGRYPYQDRFTAIDGGGYCYVSPDDGDEITGLGIQHIQTTQKIITVYKKYSTHVISLDTVQLGNYVILDPQVTTLSISSGASSGDTVIAVEQDTYSFGRKGLYSTGQEPQYLNQIRTNELTARIRPYVQNLSNEDFETANAAYIDYKYLLNFPNRKETIVYDRQRSCFMGPWKFPAKLQKWLKYYDSDSNEKWLAIFGIQSLSGSYDTINIIGLFSESFISDGGETINKILRTKKESFGEWNTMKMMKYFYFLIRNARGQFQINLRLEGRTGLTTTQKSTTITATIGNGGWGSDIWGSQQWGQSSSTVILTGDELARYSIIYKQFRTMQIEVIGNSVNSNFEFLGTKATAVSLGPSSLPSSYKV